MFEKVGNFLIEKINPENYQAIAIGMGMGCEAVSQKALKEFLLTSQKNQIPLVLDADALNF